MPCDSCNKASKKLTQVNLITGTRGRPPKRNYCDKCLEEKKGTYRTSGESASNKAERGARREQVSREREATKILREAEKARKAEAIRLGLEKPRRVNTSNKLIVQEGFDPACLFYLTAPFDNLFETTHSRDEWTYRCKGCRGIVRRTDRERHYNSHRNKSNEDNS